MNTKNLKEKFVRIANNRKLVNLFFLCSGILMVIVVCSFLVSQKELSKKYFTFSELSIANGNTLSCTSVSEANIFAYNLSSYNKKVYSSISNKPQNKFSLGIDLENQTISLITSAAVEAGVIEADKYQIIEYVPESNITAIGYSGASLVTVMINIKDGTVVVNKAVDFLGLSGAVWFATCY